MSDYGIVTAADTVRFERLLPGPIERVWAFLTESDKRARWLASGPMELRVGGGVELVFRNSELSSSPEVIPDKYRKYQDGAGFTAIVTRCEPPCLLSHTWGGNKGEESEVTYELTPQGDRVRLVLTHRRLGGRAAMLSVSGGWHTHLDILVAQLEDRTPGPFWTTFGRLETEYETRLQAG
ncbi:SRPBCC family protein [Microvirga sp. GCM10011540]|uniref:SRPBCC family protein n=1 Tax=Microvirga sp. GCM10011540 TaxID=3317338 RepID=UPI00361D267B